MYFDKANNLLKRFTNAQNVEKDSLEKLAIFEQQYHLTSQLIEEIIKKQKEFEISMLLNIILFFLILFLLTILILSFISF